MDLLRLMQQGISTKPDSYRWQASYADDGSGPLCHECIKADPTDYLQSLEGLSNRCVTIDLDLEEAGYKLLADDFENGLYGGQSDRPELIAQALREQGISVLYFTGFNRAIRHVLFGLTGPSRTNSP